MFKKTLSPEEFRNIRENADLTRGELAELMGWSVSRVNDYETKECKMGLNEFQKFMMVTSTSKEDREERLELFKYISDKIRGFGSTS